MLHTSNICGCLCLIKSFGWPYLTNCDWLNLSWPCDTSFVSHASYFCIPYRVWARACVTESCRWTCVVACIYYALTMGNTSKTCIDIPIEPTIHTPVPAPERRQADDQGTDEDRRALPFGIVSFFWIVLFVCLCFLMWCVFDIRNVWNVLSSP